MSFDADPLTRTLERTNTQNMHSFPPNIGESVLIVATINVFALTLYFKLAVFVVLSDPTLNEHRSWLFFFGYD